MKGIKKIHQHGPYKPFTKTVLWLMRLTTRDVCTAIVYV